MRNPLNRFLFMLALVAVFGVTGCDDDDDDNMTNPMPGQTMVRVGHLSPDTGPVDVLVDDAVVLEDVDFTDFSNYLELDTGMTNVKVTPANMNGTVAIEADLDLMDGVVYTVIATGLSGDGSLGAEVLVDDLTKDAANASIRFVHASPDAPNVDITLPDGTVLFDDVAFGDADEDRLVTPGGAYDLQARVAGTETVALWLDDVTVMDNAVYTVYAIGTLADGTLRALVTVDEMASGSTSLELPAATTELRVAHLSPDAPNVDVWLDGALVNALVNVPFEAVSDYLTVTAGTHNVQVFETGTSTTAVIDVDLTLAPDLDYTAAATGLVSLLGQNDPAALGATLITYDGQTPMPGQALVRFVHASPDAPAVDVSVADGGPTLFDNTEFLGIREFVGVDAGTYDLEVTLEAGGALALSVPDVTLNAGDVVTIYATGQAGDETLNALPVMD